MMTKPWHEYKTAIVRLYINEGRTLADVRGIMKETYGFDASIRSYRQHFDTWGVGKYNCKKRDLRREKKVRARQCLPSPPPETPMVGTVPIERLMTSPESLTRSSSISSSQSILSETSPRVIQPRPLHRPYWDGHAFQHTGAGFKGQHPRCLNADGPPSGVWGDIDLHNSVLRNPNISDGVLPSLAGDGPDMPHGRGLTKYVPVDYQEPSWNRSAYQVSHAESEYYSSACKDSIPRCMPETFSPPFHRPGEYQYPLRAPRPLLRLPMVQAATAEQATIE